MSRATTLQLVDDFSRNRADLAVCAQYYSDVVADLARRQQLTAATLLPTTPETGVYALPDTLVETLAVFYDTHELALTERQQLQYLKANWRDVIGAPEAYFVEDEPDNNLRLYPKPDVSSKDFIFLFGSPFGLDFPAYSLGLIHTETRQDAPDYFDLPITLAILAREFSRDSDHREPEFADACRQLANLLFSIVLDV